MMDDQSKPPNKHVLKFDFMYFIAVMFAVLFIRDFLVGQGHVKTIPERSRAGRHNEKKTGFSLNGVEVLHRVFGRIEKCENPDW